MGSIKNGETSELRREIAMLGAILGDTIREIAGDQAFALVEELREIAWNRRELGNEENEAKLTERISELSHDELRVVIRGFTIFLDLLNLAEDRQRVRVLEERVAEKFPAPPGESVTDAVRELKQAGMSDDELRSLLRRVGISLVFTAHPTDAKRQSIRRKLIRVRELLGQSDHTSNPYERSSIEDQIRAEIARLWQTDFIRPWRPSVMQEVRRGLSIKPTLWKVAPEVVDELQRAVTDDFGAGIEVNGQSLQFGSWIGGDRDGHPGVTAAVTAETFQWLRDAALRNHQKTCDELFESLSFSTRQSDIPASLGDAVNDAIAKYNELEPIIAAISPNEVCRHWLAFIGWRLEQTASIQIDPASDQDSVSTPRGAYLNPLELLADVQLLHEAIDALPAGQIVSEGLQRWIRQIEMFGLHLAKLDVRQDARVYRGVINELLSLAGFSEQPEQLDEAARCAVLTETIFDSIDLTKSELSPEATETLQLFWLLHRVAATCGQTALGGHVISMTSSASDVLSVLWLWKQTASESGRETSLAIIPLLETIDDLEHGPSILSAIFSHDLYRKELASEHDRQVVMLGYSDSTKDGGYLSACWSLQQAQTKLIDVANSHRVELDFFHGRGGSLGRGGGPTARSILSLPAGAFHGSLRLTEQGEVLADRYDDPAIARRHLEQVLWSSLLAASRTNDALPSAWTERIDQMAGYSLVAYRELIERPDFVSFFRRVTPIAEIEQLPIGSRPSRRRGGNQLSDLRAIPWVFSWTQSRCLIPAWYGLGTAIRKAKTDSSAGDLLSEMYQQWPFFRACIDNAELALAKSDLGIARHYAQLADDRGEQIQIAKKIEDEFIAARAGVLELTGRDELLDATPWLKESIRVRNRYIDPLNLIQVELLRRGQSKVSANTTDDETQEELRHLTRLTVNGIAAGMRTSG